MISKKEWEKIDGEKMENIVKKYGADVSCSLSSKVKRSPLGDEVAEKVEVENKFVSQEFVDRSVSIDDSDAKIKSEKIAKINDDEFNKKSLDYSKKEVKVVFDADKWVNIIDGVEVLSYKENGIWKGNDAVEMKKISPKDLGLRKNKEGKNNLRDYIFPQDSEDVESVFPVAKGWDKDNYVYGLDELKEAYKFVNADSKIVINDRWKRYLRLNKEEKRVIKEMRGE